MKRRVVSTPFESVIHPVSGVVIVAVFAVAFLFLCDSFEAACMLSLGIVLGVCSCFHSNLNKLRKWVVVTVGSTAEFLLVMGIANGILFSDRPLTQSDVIFAGTVFALVTFSLVPAYYAADSSKRGDFWVKAPWYLLMPAGVVAGVYSVVMRDVRFLGIGLAILFAQLVLGFVFLNPDEKGGFL